MEELIKLSKQEIKEIINKHKLWLNSNGVEGVKANFSNTDLSGIDLKNINLSNADFSNSILSHVDFTNSNLSGANLSNADLSDSKLSQAKLSNADLSGTEIVGVDFSGTVLTNISINYNDLSYFPQRSLEKYAQTFKVLDWHKQPFITRSIEFSTEYSEAGKGILSYFGTILNQKYPDKQTSVTIKQEGLKLTMTIETEEGDREEIEQFLDQYGLVISNKMNPEDFLENRIHILELKQELKIAKVRLEQKQELLEYTKNDLKEARLETKELISLIGQSIQNTKNSSSDIFPNDQIESRKKLKRKNIFEDIIESKTHKTQF